MKPENIPALRLGSQYIATTQCESPKKVLAWLGAIQAQDYAGAKWSIGLRLPDATDEQIERAIADKKIVRTWLMRGTLHFAAAEDIRWMLAILSPRLVAGSAGRCRQLELDENTFAQSGKLFSQALQGGQQVTRDEMYELLERDGISTSGQRGYHILWRHAQEGLICFAPMRGKQQTFALLDDWVPSVKIPAREDAIAVLAKRYFVSRGPATLQDFVWWSGLKVSEARAGLEAVAPELISETIGKQTYWLAPGLQAVQKLPQTVHLLPGFDEYILGYQDRSAVLEPQYAQQICPGNNGMFMPTMVINGRVEGIWKRTLKKKTVSLLPSPFRQIKAPYSTGLEAAAEWYGRFLNLPVSLSDETLAVD